MCKTNQQNWTEFWKSYNGTLLSTLTILHASQKVQTTSLCARHLRQAITTLLSYQKTQSVSSKPY